MSRNPSKASVTLTQILVPKKVYTLSEVAEILGVSKRRVSSWCDGTSIPSAQHACALQEMLEIPTSEWDFYKGEKVYFLQRGENGPIKIGFSKNPKGRIAAIQSSCAEPVELLLLLSVDTQKREYEIHDKFKHLRLKGEWFKPASDLIAWIQEQIVSVGSEELEDIPEYLCKNALFESQNPHGF